MKDSGMIDSGELAWACLFHFGTHMWGERPASVEKAKSGSLGGTCEHFRFDEEVWRRWTDAMANGGMNMVVMDIGEGLAYPSHPELGIKGSWSADRLHDEVVRLRRLGLEPIPKLNFSSTHDTWLGDYSRMVSTATYYNVCHDVLADLVEIFEKPRFFHIGYDEETAIHQKRADMMIVRQGELWWHDLLWFERTIADMGSRPWMWADYIWWHRKEFVERMPKRVLQSNWYYNSDKIDPRLHKGPVTREEIDNNWDQRVWTAAFQWLEDAAFDQMPCGSNYETDCNFAAIVEWGRTHVPPERLKGFCMAPWILTLPPKLDKGLAAIDIVRRARADFEAKGVAVKKGSTSNA